jgi:putative membrane protein
MKTQMERNAATGNKLLPLAWQILAAILIAMSFMMAGCNDDDDDDNVNGSLNATDREFMARVTEANKAEIEAGSTASTKGLTDSVRQYGQLMVTEHTMAENSLDSLANVLGVTLADTLSAEHQALKQMLNNTTGYAFDTLYIGSQLRDHQKVIGFFNNEISNGSHPSVKGYANRYLPHIQMHYQRADSIRRVLGF